MSELPEDLIQRYHHAWENRHRLGALGAQDLDLMMMALVRLQEGMARMLVQSDEQLEEIQKLQAWKQEAMWVLVGWEQCYDTLSEAGYPAQVGKSRAKHVREEIERLLARSDGGWR